MSTLLFWINDEANVLGLDWDAHLKSSTGTIKDFDASKVDIGPTPTCVQKCTFRMATRTLFTVHSLLPGGITIAEDVRKPRNIQKQEYKFFGFFWFAYI